MITKLLNKIYPKYEHSSLLMLLYNSGSRYMRNKNAIKRNIKGGNIALMTKIYGDIIERIYDPHYVPKDGDVFSMYDGMFGCSNEWYVCTGSNIVPVNMEHIDLIRNIQN